MLEVVLEKWEKEWVTVFKDGKVIIDTIKKDEVNYDVLKKFIGDKILIKTFSADNLIDFYTATLSLAEGSLLGLRNINE